MPETIAQRRVSTPVTFANLVDLIPGEVGGTAGVGTLQTLRDTIQANLTQIVGAGSLVAATGNEIAWDLSYTVNKATSGNDTGIFLNKTDTNSPGTSLLMDLQVGGTTKHNVEDDGTIYATELHIGSSTVNFNFVSSALLLGLRSAAVLAWYDGANLAAGGSYDVILQRIAANTLGLINGANAQKYNVYTTDDGSGNNSGLSIEGTAISLFTAGTEPDNIDLALTPAGTGVVKFGSHTALGGETVSGYITVKDAGGTSRKLAVVA